MLRMLASATEHPSVREAIAYSVGRTVRPNNPASRRRAIDVLEPLLAPPAASQAPSPDRGIREGAIWSLGQIGGARAERAVVAALDDEDARIREAAADALGTMGSGAAVPRLSSMVTGDKAASARGAAARALGAIGDPAALRALFRALDDGDAYVRRTAEQALARIKADDLGPLREALADPSPRVRAEAIDRMGPTPPADALEVLLRALGDEEYSVRAAAIRLLAARRDDAWIAGLAAALANESLLVRMGAAAALGQTRAPAAAAPLLAHLSAEQNTSVRAEVVRALAAVGRGRGDVSARLQNEAADLDPLIRQAAAEALAAFPDEGSTRTLRTLATDDVEEVRTAAIQSLRALDVK